MDGDLYAVKTENAAVPGELFSDIGFDYQTGRESGSLNKRFRNESGGIAPIVCLMLQTITVAAAILGTCAAAWLGHLFLTPRQTVGQLVPDFVALLVFLLAARFR